MTAQEDFSFDLGDDGTLDTVVVVTCNRCGESWEQRYNPDEHFRIAEAFDMARKDVDDEGCQKCDGGEA